MYSDFVVLRVDDISIVGQLFLPDKQSKYPLVCLCHGVPSGNPPEPGDGGYPALAEKICGEGLGVFFFNFRGAGHSGGNIDFLGWTRDLKAVIDYLCDQETISSSSLFLTGFSAGAAVSIYVASKDERVSGVAACACPANFGFFTEAKEPQAIVDRYREIGVIRDEDFPPSMKEWFDNLGQITPSNHIAGIAPRPLLLIHGSDDDIVPLNHALQLYEKAGKPKKLVILEGAGHKLRRDNRAINAIVEWIQSGF
jgi:dipeptidyl aminopeptidase/acylaminoacyl peptidase